MAESAASRIPDAAMTLEHAQRELLTRKDLQFHLDAAPPVNTPDPPGWLQALANFLGSLFTGAAPLMEVLFWTLVVLAVLAIIFLIAREAGALEWTRKAKPKAAVQMDLYRPDAQVAKALLDDADQLAAQGRYAEAVHVLLLRSIEDMRRWRPRSVEPSFTSRDIGGLSVLPEMARNAFAAMARLVETSLFGGRPVDASGFAESRKAYEAFAFPDTWA